MSTVVPVKSKFEWAFVPSCHVNTGSSTWCWNCFAWRARRGGNSVFRILWLLFWSVDNASHGFPACLVETECFQALEVAETCEQNSHGICIGVADVICFRLWSWRHSALVNKTTCICKRLFSPPRVARLETQGALLILRCSLHTLFEIAAHIGIHRNLRRSARNREELQEGKVLWLALLLPCLDRNRHVAWPHGPWGLCVRPFARLTTPEVRCTNQICTQMTLRKKRSVTYSTISEVSIRKSSRWTTERHFFCRKCSLGMSL